MSEPQTSAVELSAGQLATVAVLLEEALGDPLAGPLQSSLIAGGRSNLTFHLTDGQRDWVLRRPPMGGLAEKAHDMGREYSVMSALAPTAVPVPVPVLHQDTTEALESPFYVMTMVEGTVLRTDADVAALAEASAGRTSRSFINALASLHSVDPRYVGLDKLGRPQGYLARQLGRWSSQLRSPGYRDTRDLAALGERLAAHVPASERSSIVHGDFRLDNVILDPSGSGEVLAVLDWEMATLGDPLADLALTWLYWEGWSGVPNPVAGTPADHPGFEPWTSMVTRYARQTGADLSGFAWYQAFAAFKFSVIAEGIHHRFVNGNTVGEGFDQIGAMVPELVRRAQNLLDSA